MIKTIRKTAQVAGPQGVVDGEAPQYAAHGTYTITLTVTDSRGKTNTASRTVTV